MAFKAEIFLSAPQSGQFKDAKFTVMECDYPFTVNEDLRGRIVSRRKVGIINLLVEFNPDVVLLSNGLFTNAIIEGSIIFYNRDAYSKLLEVEFKNARFLTIHTRFGSTGDTPMTTFISISAEKLTLTSDGKMAEDTNDWSGETDYE